MAWNNRVSKSMSRISHSWQTLSFITLPLSSRFNNYKLGRFRLHRLSKLAISASCKRSFLLKSCSNTWQCLRFKSLRPNLQRTSTKRKNSRKRTTPDLVPNIATAQDPRRTGTSIAAETRTEDPREGLEAEIEITEDTTRETVLLRRGAEETEEDEFMY